MLLIPENSPRRSLCVSSDTIQNPSRDGERFSPRSPRKILGEKPPRGRSFLPFHRVARRSMLTTGQSTIKYISGRARKKNTPGDQSSIRRSLVEMPSRVFHGDGEENRQRRQRRRRPGRRIFVSPAKSCHSVDPSRRAGTISRPGSYDGLQSAYSDGRLVPDSSSTRGANSRRLTASL